MKLRFPNLVTTHGPIFLSSSFPALASPPFLQASQSVTPPRPWHRSMYSELCHFLLFDTSCTPQLTGNMLRRYARPSQKTLITTLPQHRSSKNSEQRHRRESWPVKDNEQHGLQKSPQTSVTRFKPVRSYPLYSQSHRSSRKH